MSVYPDPHTTTLLTQSIALHGRSRALQEHAAQLSRRLVRLICPRPPETVLGAPDHERETTGALRRRETD